MRKTILALKEKYLPDTFWVSFLFLVCSVLSLPAQDVLLGQYEFVTGSNQEKASLVAAGLSFSDIMFESTRFVDNIDYIDNTVVTSNWYTGLQMSNGLSAQFTITKGVFLSEFHVSEVILHYKATGAPHQIVMHAGFTKNSGGDTRTTIRTGQNAPDFKTINLPEGLNTSYYVPVVTDATPLYLAVGFTQALQEDEVVFDRIEVWGTATTAPSAVTVDILSKTIHASQDNAVSFPVQISGLTAEEDVSVSVTGEDAAYFSIDHASILAADLNVEDQIVNVTYDATVNTFSQASGVHVPHNATLIVESSEITPIEIPVYATNHVLYEDFIAYDTLSVWGEDLSLYPAIPNNDILTHVPGWTGAYLYPYKTGSTIGSVNLASSSTDSSYLYTPQLDLSQPFSFSVVTRSFIKDTDGRLFVYLDDGQLVFSGERPSNNIITFSSEGFVGTSTSQLKFTGIKNDTNQMIVDDIIIDYTNNPALNVALSQEEAFGVVSPGANKTVSIPLKGYNLTGDVSLSLQDGSNFSITSGATVVQATATSGTDIDVQFTAPVTHGKYEDVLTLTTSDITRSITLQAFSDTGTSLAGTADGNVLILPDGVVLTGFQGKNVAVYAISGQKMKDRINIKPNEKIEFKQKGYYIIHIFDDAYQFTRKVVIQ